MGDMIDREASDLLSKGDPNLIKLSVAGGRIAITSYDQGEGFASGVNRIGAGTRVVFGASDPDRDRSSGFRQSRMRGVS